MCAHRTRARPHALSLNSSLKFENSYLAVQCSKNHETNSIAFVISRSIHEKILNRIEAFNLNMFPLILESNSFN
jgi:hypothetical protein